MNQHQPEESYSHMQSLIPPPFSPANMSFSNENNKDLHRPLTSPHGASSIGSAYTTDFFRRFHQHRISDGTADSMDSSPTTTVSTVEDSSSTEPSPGSSPESPPSTSFATSMLRPRTTEDSRPFFGLQKLPPPKKGRNLKNLAVNTTGRPGITASTPSLPILAPLGNATAQDRSATFVKPLPTLKKKPNHLGLTLLTPGLSQSQFEAVPPTPSLGRLALRHFQSSPALPLVSIADVQRKESRNAMHGIVTLPTIQSPTEPVPPQGLQQIVHQEEESNFDVPLSREAKPEAYPDGPICVYSPYVDLYLEPTVEQARNYDVIMNVAIEVPNPFVNGNPKASDGSEVRMDGGGGIQYAPRRDRVAERTTGGSVTGNNSPSTPKASSANIATTKDVVQSSMPKDPEYIHIPWEHNSDIVVDLLRLCKVIDDKVQSGKRVLVHCQCGVSRSASLVVAYGIYKNPTMSVQEAYDAVKQRSKWIGPNMNLIMQLQEFRTSLLRNENPGHGAVPELLTPSSALGEWPYAFGANSPRFLSQSPLHSNHTVLHKRSATDSTSPSRLAPSSAPSGMPWPLDKCSDASHIGRGRAASAARPISTTPSPISKVQSFEPYLQIVEPMNIQQSASTSDGKLRDLSSNDTDATTPTAKPGSVAAREFTMVPLQPSPDVQSMDAFGLMSPKSTEFLSHSFDQLTTCNVATPTADTVSARMEELPLAPLKPSPELQSADDFGLMSPTSTEFSSDPFDRSALLAQLGMGPVNQAATAEPKRSRSLRPTSRKLLGVDGQDKAHRLRGKISSPTLREQHQLQSLQAQIQANLTSRAAPANSSSVGPTPSTNFAEEALMSPRATEFTQNPFALSLTVPELGSIQQDEPTTPHASDVDPRSPPLKGVSPITRNIFDVL